jgi:hypothetical protein
MEENKELLILNVKSQFPLDEFKKITKIVMDIRRLSGKDIVL